MTTTKATHHNSAIASQQNPRQAHQRFASNNLNNTQQFNGTTVLHPSMIKTNNLMMDTQGIKIEGAKKAQQNLNNTTIQPISQNLAYGAVKGEKSPVGNTRNWRTKSIDSTPDGETRGVQHI